MGMRLLLALPLALCLRPALSAQTSHGRLAGRVTDQQAAVIPGVRVALTQVETNIVTQTVANGEGLYDFPNLLPGAYRMTMSHDGFKKYSRAGLVVRVGDVAGVDVQLEVGATTDSIAVTAEASLLETSTAAAGNVIDNKTLSDLPLSGRGVSFLMTLSPGVISTNAPMHGWLPQARGSVSDLAVSGSRTRSSEFTLDGIPNMEKGGTIAFQPPPEMIQEFRVQTAAYDAAVGHFSGANINMVLKGGANDYHGSLWFSHLSRPLMTHPFFVNRNLYDLASGPPTAAKRSGLWPATKTNRYRGQIGGPVRIPKLYDGRNKSFFSYGNDFMLRTFANLSTQTVPTAEERRGDFSALLKAGANYQIYDPSSVAAAPDGRFSRLPLAGNIVPASRISPIAANMLAYYPLPNASGTIDGRNNYFATAASRIDYWSHMGRFDQAINDRHRFYMSLSAMRTDGDQGRNLVNDAIGNITVNKYAGSAFDYVWMARPTLVVNLRYGLTRMRSAAAPPTLGLDLAKLGLPSSFTKQFDGSLTSLPSIAPDGFATIGNNTVSNSGFLNHFMSGTVSKVMGEHTLRFGGEHRVLLDNNYDYGNYTGSFTFGPAWTRGPLDNSPAAPIGQGLASMLFGLPSDGFIDNNAAQSEKSTYSGLFFQDDWKLTRKLTVNLGLRWEREGPITERYNRMNRGFDLAATNPADAAARAAYALNPIADIAPADFRLRGGLLFAAAGSQPRGLWNGDNNNFAPRGGIAYSMNAKTVIRAGFGMFYESLGADRQDGGQLGFSQRTRLNPSSDNGFTFGNPLSNPFSGGLLAPKGSAGGLATYLGLGPGFYDPSRRTGYMKRGTFTLQRQVGTRWLLEMGYTGNRGDQLGLAEDYNAVPAQYLSRSPVRDDAAINALSRNVVNPFRGLEPFSNSPAFFANTSLARSQLLRPYPQYSGLSTSSSNGFSWYNAGHVRVERRFQRYSFSGQYTWSKFMEAVEKLNATDTEPHHVVSPQDRPHHIALSGMWDVPAGRGRRWFAQAPRAVNAIAGGWSVNLIYQWQSGPPIGFGNVIFNGALADIVLPRDQRTVRQWFRTDQFERRSTAQLDSNLRAFPPRLTGLRADGWNQWDAALFKEFRFTERIKMQLRAEAVDALNTAMFAAPNTAPANTLFGTVNATIWTEQRKITVAAKFSW